MPRADLQKPQLVALERPPRAEQLLTGGGSAARAVLAQLDRDSAPFDRIGASWAGWLRGVRVPLDLAVPFIEFAVLECERPDRGTVVGARRVDPGLEQELLRDICAVHALRE